MRLIEYSTDWAANRNGYFRQDAILSMADNATGLTWELSVLGSDFFF